jgi:hypothetical protein
MPFQAPHRPEPGLQPSVICGDLGRDRARAQRPGKEAPGGRQVTPPGQQDVDDLAMLVARPVKVGPLAGDLHLHPIGEPPVTRSVTA